MSHGRATLTGKLSMTATFTGHFTLLHAANASRILTFSSYSFTYTGCFSASITYHTNNDGTSDVNLHVISTCD